MRWHISKKRCSEKHCACDKAYQFSASQGYLENLTISDKFINNQATLYTSKDVPLKHVEKKKIMEKWKILLERHNRNISLKIYWDSHLCEMAV